MGVVNGSDYGLPTLDLNFARTKSLIDTVTKRNLITFTRSSTGTYVGSDGLIKYAAANEPRFDHNPVTGESLGLLVEESRTNLIDQGNTPVLRESYGKLSRTISNNILTPFGDYSNVAVFTRTSSSTLGPETIGPSGNITLVDGQTYTFSVFYKPLVGNFLGTFTDPYFLAQAFSPFSQITPAFTSNSIVYPNGWIRYYASGTITSTQSGYITAMRFGADGSINDPTGKVGISAAFWGLQIEQGSFPTSYIPTSGSTVTRSADDASITGTNFSSFYNQSEGTWFIDFANDAAKHTTGFDGVLSLDTNTPRIIGSSIIGFGGATNISPVSARQKVGLAYGTTEGRSFNGTISSGSGGVSSRTQVKIGTGAVTASNYELSTTISRLTYYPKRLPNYQLQALTR